MHWLIFKSDGPDFLSCVMKSPNRALLPCILIIGVVIGLFVSLGSGLSFEFTAVVFVLMLIGVSTLWVTWRKPEWVFALFVLALPFDNHDFLGVSVSDLLLVCLFIKAILIFKFRGHGSDAIYIWMASMAVALFFSLWASINPSISARPTFTVVAMMTIPIVVLNLGPRLNFTQVAKTILVSSAIISILALVQLLAHQLGYTLWYHHATSSRDLRYHVFRVVGSYVNPNHLAFFLLPCVVFVLYLPFYERKWWAIGVLDFVVLCLTYTRSYILLALLFILGRMFGCFDKRARLLIVPGLIVATIALMPLWVEIANFVRDFNPVSFEHRFSYLGWGIQTFINNPVTGIGLGNFRYYVVESHLGIDRPAHNTFLQVAIGLGVIGLLAFGGIIITAFLTAWRWAKRLGRCVPEWYFWRALSMSALAAVTASLFIDALTLKNLWLWLGLLASIIFLQSEAGGNAPKKFRPVQLAQRF